MTTAQHQRQFGGYWQQQQADSDFDESENYFPEPTVSPWQRDKLPAISDQPSSVNHTGGGFRRGRLVTFHRNGDFHFKGLSASISQRAFASMESLLAWLSEKIPTTAGVRHVLRLPDGRPVRDVSEFQPGGHYAVSSVRRLVRGPDYGGVCARESVRNGDDGRQPRPWLGDGPTSVAGRMRHSDIRLLARAGEEAGVGGGSRRMNRMRRSQMDASGSSSGRPRLITVVSNSHRSSREKVLLNPGTRLNFEDLLVDFTSLLTMSGPPVRALYGAIPPYRRVESFSQLFREFKDHDTFIACGRELTPVELVGVAGRRDGGASTSTSGAEASMEKSPRKVSRLSENDRHQYG